MFYVSGEKFIGHTVIAVLLLSVVIVTLQQRTELKTDKNGLWSMFLCSRLTALWCHINFVLSSLLLLLSIQLNFKSNQRRVVNFERRHTCVSADAHPSSSAQRDERLPLHAPQVSSVNVNGIFIEQICKIY